MKQYIDKSVVIAEIERRIAEYKDMKIDSSYYEEMVASLEFLRDEFINTLEVEELPIWEKVSPDTGQTTLYLDGDKSYLERFGYRIDLKDLDKLPKENLKAQKGEEV